MLRLDLRGHGLSAELHEPAEGPEQYRWERLAEDLRAAVRSSLPGAFLGGEGWGAAVALTLAATSAAPPGLVLLNPCEALGEGAWRGGSEALAAAAEAGGWDAVEKLEAEMRARPFLANASTRNALRRGSLSAEVFAAALRGHVASTLPGQEQVAAMQEERTVTADDVYGVPITSRCPVLVLALAENEAARRLAERLPRSELLLAESAEVAREAWPKEIGEFLKRAWMTEFLTKRVMPQ